MEQASLQKPSTTPCRPLQNTLAPTQDFKKCLSAKLRIYRRTAALASSGGTHRCCTVAILRLLPCGGHGGTLWTYEKKESKHCVYVRYLDRGRVTHDDCTVQTVPVSE